MESSNPNGLLRVFVSSCSNVPNPDRFSVVDPYVNLEFQGIKKKTNYKKSELNPVWNEKLDFDLKGTPINSSDIIEVQLKDYENIGVNKLLAKGIIPLNQLINSGSLKYQVELTDPDNNKLESTKLMVNIEYKPPTSLSTAPKPAPVGGGDVTESPSSRNQSLDPGGNGMFDDVDGKSFRRKENKVLSTKPQDFQVRIKVFEGRHLDGNNIHPMCVVKCSNMTKNTKKMRSTNSPYFDEVFFFNFNTSPADLFDQIIEFQVFNAMSFHRSSLIGTFKMDIGYVYDEPKHSLVSKWLLLGDPEDCMAGAKGYLKVTINVLGPGDEVPPNPDPSVDDDMESNLLKPAGMMLRPATFSVKIYRAEDLPRMDSNLFQGIKSVFSSSDDKKELVDPYVVVSFAGKKVQTKIIYSNANPEWNQELKIGLKFPSMCDKIQFAVKDWDRTSEDDFNSVFYLPLSLISDLQPDGFLPTFGPCYINMYGGPREFSELPTALDELNLGKGEGVAYRGRILLELSTILNEIPTEILTEIKHTEVLKIDPFLRRNKFKLHAAFLDATMISEVEKSIEFEVSIGNYGNKLDENVLPSSSTTPPCNPVFDGCAYYFLPWGDIKPCMQIASYWEDITFRLESLNQIKKLKSYISSCVSNIKMRITILGENSVINPTEMSQLAVTILKMIETIKYKASTPLPEPVIGKHQTNDLDKFLRQIRMRHLRTIVSKCEKLPNMEFKLVLEEMESFVDMLNQVEQEPQNSIPDIIIWMLCGNERTAYYRIPAYDIIYSPKPECKGEFCSVVQTFTLKWPGKIAEDKTKRIIIPAQVRVKLWLGLEKDEKDWLQTHSDEESIGAISIYAETYENQAYSWTSLKWSSDGLSRATFSDPTGKIALPKEKFILPEGWEWKEEWHVAPELSLIFDKDAGHNKFLEEVYEQNMRSIPGAAWSNGNAEKKPYNWANYRGEKQVNKDEIVLSENWKWDDEWSVDINRAVDNEGWEYCVEPSMGGWSPAEKVYHLNRRRRWVRNRSIVATENQGAIQKKDVEEALKEGWEYAKLFTTKFHGKEHPTDTVRRRRWHRAMQPVSKTADLTAVFRIETDDANKYQLRAYIYQARSLLAADTDTSMSDPFCQVSFVTQSMKTEIIFKTLSPTWDQTLIYETVEIYGNPKEIEENPPDIMIEIFDHDLYGAPDFLGRCVTKPIVKNIYNIGTNSKLEWFSLKRGNEDAGELLACFELFYLEDKEAIVPTFPPKIGALYRLPSDVRPELQRTIIEILAWGVRNMKTFQLSDVDRPQVVFECGGSKLETEVIKNVKQNPNFSKPALYFDIMIPKEEAYVPPMNIKVIDHRHFGRKPIVGVHVIKSLSKFRISREKQQMAFNNYEAIQSGEQTIVKMETSASDSENLDASMKKKLKKFLKVKGKGATERRVSKFKRISNVFGNVNASDLAIVEEDIDWWCKFYASLGETKKCGSYIKKGYERITIYNEELEKQKKFDNFTDFCDTFQLVRGKTVTDEENNIVGEFKGMLKVYAVSEDTQNVLDNLIYRSVIPMNKEECLLRIYVVRGIDLQGLDSNGKSDAYIQIEVGKTKVNSRDKYIPNSNNPEFGRMFELTVTLPQQKDLCIKIKDYDLISSDEIIGETWIDLEDRLLTKYRATCGLPITYNESGVNKWRDSRKPSQILTDICKSRNLNCVLPKTGETYLTIEDKVFTLQKYESKHFGNLVNQLRNPHLGEKSERLCLHVLNEFGLVPEHVETRRLYNPIQPGMEQGRLQMWVDIFPKSLGAPEASFDISPRKPKKYVLRCIIWNTSEVPCDDVSITGELMSDIYLKGWLQGLEEDKQTTDIHYRSMDGEGNFNWRFTFDFEYLPAEQNLVVKKKEHFWSLDETVTKMPPVYTIQIWDNDKFSADDFLGQVSLNLNKLIKPAKDSKSCGLHQLPDTILDHDTDHGQKNANKNYISLFDQRRIKGWWPCIVELPEGKQEMAGKVEMELEILTEEEAKERPSGRGREEPNLNPRLEPPNRPETSFLWFTSPLKSFQFVFWRRYKFYIITGLILLSLFIFAALMIYTLPGALWNRLLKV